MGIVCPLCHWRRRWTAETGSGLFSLPFPVSFDLSLFLSAFFSFLFSFSRVGNRFVLTVLIDVHRTLPRQFSLASSPLEDYPDESPPTDIFAIVAAPSFNRLSNCEVYSYHTFSWTLLQILPAPTSGSSSSASSRSSSSRARPGRGGGDGRARTVPGERAGDREHAVGSRRQPRAEGRGGDSKQEEEKQRHDPQHTGGSCRDAVDHVPEGGRGTFSSGTQEGSRKRDAEEEREESLAEGGGAGGDEEDACAKTAECVRERWLGIADFGVFTRCGFYDWRICRAKESDGSW